ncbi:MAG: HAMP domain-containing histidine kinase, partial [Solirubrobacteraceae bacterium]|nr:HAMP domain-containing histidine kinase [Solirubrobacteraceae bacterium]
MLERLSIRWRLALISAALTLFILCGFAFVVGGLTVQRIRQDFSSETANAASTLRDRLSIDFTPTTIVIKPNLELFAAANDAAIRLFDRTRRPIEGAQTPHAPDLGPPLVTGSSEVGGYLLETRHVVLRPSDAPESGITFGIWIQYARPLEDVEHTVTLVRLFLAGGVLAGTLLALLGGLLLARRSLRPVTALTATARAIARTGDPDRQVPQPRADDEVAELARTFDEMLGALEESRRATETALHRQREFVADASHELRTPLTSVLANLELLTDELQGDPREAAEAALRSTRRMRRLVADLLLLARSDAGHVTTRAQVDLGAVALEAVAEAGALSEDHEIRVHAAPHVLVDGARDELHRLVLNLVENAIRHTPAETHICVRVAASDGDAVLSVEDDGPGIPPGLRDSIFERFARDGRDRAGSTGLGLAIVRAVAAGHGGGVTLEDAEPGSRFVVRLPLSAGQADAAPTAPEAES